MVRNEQDELKGFHNTCRHRGSALCLTDQGTFPGRLIRCPYHQWSYTLDGHLVSTTSKAHPGDFDRTDYPLFPVSVREWRGGVFASLADNPPHIEQGFGRGSEKTENWPMEKTGRGPYLSENHAMQLENILGKFQRMPALP